MSPALFIEILNILVLGWVFIIWSRGSVLDLTIKYAFFLLTVAKVLVFFKVIV